MEVSWRFSSADGCAGACEAIYKLYARREGVFCLAGYGALTAPAKESMEKPLSSWP